MLRLYDYWRSSAAYRVRIALSIKGLKAELVPINLLGPGDQHGPAYGRVNPQRLVPALAEDDDVFTQSLAIIEYLEEIHPEPPLLPQRPHDRARVRAMALCIATDIHPIQNLRVLEYLRHQLGTPEERVQAFARHWVELGLTALVDLIARVPVRGRYCHGDTVTLADVVLVPQLVNARRFNCDLTKIERLLKIESELMKLPSFRDASPENHPHATR